MQEFQPNDTINNRYRVIRKLGAGAMGSVYLCHDSVENDVQVALKLLISENLDDQDIWAKGEYEALTHLRHPNLAKVYNFGRLVGTNDYFIVSEFIKGLDLFSATEYLNYDELTDIVVQICRALEYIHSQGYVHFDIKPDNILVTRHKTIGIQEGSKVQLDVTDQVNPDSTLAKPHVKVIDFGLAEKITGSFSFAIKGTLNYLAPEILNGSTPDKRADLYSLGVTIFQVANRNLPFYQEFDAFETGVQPAKRSDLFESHLKKHPKFLREVILRLLEENPKDRFQSAREVIQHINRHSAYDFEVETQETRASYFYSARLVGRKKESNLLRKYYEQAFFPHRNRVEAKDPDDGDEGGEVVSLIPGDTTPPALVIVSGEMGSGKSRLLHEFQHYLRLNDLVYFHGNCYEGNCKAYQPFIEVLRQLVFRIGLDSELYQRFRTEVLKLLPDLRTAKDAGEPEDSDDDRDHGARPDKERHYFIERISQLLVEAARKVPYVLVVNNLHWIDETSTELLEKLVDRLVQLREKGDHVPLLVIGSIRPEEAAPDSLRDLLDRTKDRNLSVEIGIRRLRQGQIGEFLSSMLNFSDVPEEFVDKLQEATAGNPLFIVETLKALEDQGVIKNKGGNWEIKSSGYDRISIPRSMEDLLAIRLKKIENPRREILEALSVVGKTVSPKFIQKMKSFSTVPVLGHLRQLEHTGLVSKVFEEGKLVFEIGQQKVREIVYQKIDEERRQRFHGEIADTMREIHQGKEDEILEDLAYHYQRSDLTEKAISFTVRTGDWLRGIFANERAYECYIYVLERLEGNPDKLDVYVKTQEKLADLCVVMGRYETAETSYGVLLSDEVSSLLVPEKLVKVYLSRGRIFEIQGDYDSALKCYKDARNYLSGFDKSQLSIERIHVFNGIGWVYVCMGKYEKAMAISLEALRVIGNERDCIEHSMVYNTIGSANYYKGNIDKAIEYHRKSLEIREHLENLPDIITSLNNLGSAYIAGCEYAEALEFLSRALQMSEALGDPYGKAVTLHNFGSLYLAVGQSERGWKFLEESIALSKAHNMRFLNVQNYVLRGKAFLDRGEYAKAEGDLFRALTAFTKQGNRWGLCFVLRQLAELHRLSGSSMEAESALDEAVGYAEDLAIHALHAACLVERARLIREKSDKAGLDNAVNVLRRAIQLADKGASAELQAQVAYEMGETLVRLRQIHEATQYYEFGDRKIREITDSMPEEFRSTYNPIPGSRDARRRLSESDGHGGASADQDAQPEIACLTPEEVAEDSGVNLDAGPTSEESLRRVSQLMAALNDCGTWKEFLRTLLQEVLEFSRGDMVFWMTVQGQNVTLESSRTRENRVFGKKKDLLSLPLIEKALTDRQPIFVDRSSPILQESFGRDSAGVRSLAVLVLPLEPGVDGVLYLLNPDFHSSNEGAASTQQLYLLQPFCNLVPLARSRFEASPARV